ncbi:pyridoxamine 5'-phosphate oxidase [Notoacmeibacter ruber]|uniref:Pyridoxine/pyridoxamine 5'-phosphate oxidase n=1 Tax=Notoacmeibacter ruber TaxID=2670375 RepID=A0A3L7J9L6_9HYPH|nr:pyridoxamine 5'-phosphate oxidase [Notoacmeibacter ruber]RLQ87437.1 pyridoxamine 5'-phosphate oxidase [Notoacmeibacter ruber]
MEPTELTAGDFTEHSDPFELFRLWLADAEKTEINDANAMSLATVDEFGMPDVRVVLLKGLDEEGFVFYTNFESQKGQQLLAQHRAALCFHWKSLRRQVRIRGTIAPVAEDEADEYYASRPRGSRIGAWASQQSRPLPDRETLENAVAAYERKFEGEEPSRPPHWSGFRLTPVQIEFWHDRPFRLHDRMRFDRESETWRKTRLYP